MRFTRASMLDVLGEDYVRTARAKGLAESMVVLKHALRNALVPIVTVLGLTVALMIGLETAAKMRPSASRTRSNEPRNSFHERRMAAPTSASRVFPMAIPRFY